MAWGISAATGSKPVVCLSRCELMDRCNASSRCYWERGLDTNTPPDSRSMERRLLDETSAAVHAIMRQRQGFALEPVWAVELEHKDRIVCRADRGPAAVNNIGRVAVMMAVEVVEVDLRCDTMATMISRGLYVCCDLCGGRAGGGGQMSEVGSE